MVNMMKERNARKEYRETVTIIIRLDSGFFDEKILRACDKLGVGFIFTSHLERKDNRCDFPRRQETQQRWEFSGEYDERPCWRAARGSMEELLQ